jgi:hypothetical protein
MKNTLAENMLRFGVKNLKESDVKKIGQLHEAAQPVQPYADINPNSWKLKDDAAWQAVTMPATYPVGKVDPNAASQGAYGPWAQEYSRQANVTKKINPEADTRAQFIAEALASIMNAQGKYNPLMYKDFNMVMKSSEWVSTQLRSKITSNHAMPYATIGDTKIGLSNQINTRGEVTTQKQWEATLALIAPAITSVIQQYVITKPVAPAAAAKPTTTAPVRKN